MDSTLTLYDAPAPNPYVVRLFILERGRLDLKPYRNINPRGELPALHSGNDFILTEITAICEYLDEVANGGKSLFGETALERAETRMWLRRMDLEIAQPLIAWFRNDPATIDFYKGNRIPCPEARVTQKVMINQFLNLLEDELEGKTYLCGDRFSAADIHFFGLMKQMIEQVAPWVLSPGRLNVEVYWKRMGERAKTKAALAPFASRVTLA
ncbi:glutathione S-transferase [Aspergillus novoparasiticus]|uniref:Glutathione S-transferase n=1 Tax=Aspergillus novoparasiticus TaxID=986946 RepID=A0A5N6E983_9EURO|nr:glutathione S-transferase [Aspergillus novoparasiticus]